ncbi:MAG TPA: glycoside hydrolase family 15 protein [Chloroflexota bacterium]|nr:glycoside hydrolase family 15 protein [Chloroflexota bacterium]
MDKLIERGIAIIRAGQAESGAYVACPAYPTYHYCWFRDGAFIASAMDRWGESESARRFYQWAAAAVTARQAEVERCVAAAARGEQPNPADLLHTRYQLNGDQGADEWPNFQLDGFGTLLWAMSIHRMLHGAEGTSLWEPAARLLVRYLAALWERPNSDCWEEFSDRMAISTLAALHGGLHAAADWLGDDQAEGALARTTARAVRALAFERGTFQGHLIKQVDGDDVVDASLLWAAVPFGEHGLLAAEHPLMQATAARVERDLIGGTGGVHRYRADTFYGGGEWMLLTALLGQYRLAIGDREGANICRRYVESHADPRGFLPEQVSTAALHPEWIAEWVERWGAVASPLLWSHAEYLRLAALLLAP